MHYTTSWETYCKEEIDRITPILLKEGITLDDFQPHIIGERSMMEAVTTAHGRKVIVLGRSNSGEQLVIKASSEPGGMQELLHEQTCREALAKLPFSYHTFNTPLQRACIITNHLVCVVTEYLRQEKSFLERTTDEQFSYVHAAFTAEARAHATTKNHYQIITKTFGTKTAVSYLETHATFLTQSLPEQKDTFLVREYIEKTHLLLTGNIQRIEQYTGFLTHTDFVPHNFRIFDSTLYLLDLSSLRFGSKHESWARFINFMVLHNPQLAQALGSYMRDNRSIEEQESLRLMRMYRLGEIISFYVRAAQACSGSLHTLSKERVAFWYAVLVSLHERVELSPKIREHYIQKRDALRSPDEHKRQVGLH